MKLFHDNTDTRLFGALAVIGYIAIFSIIFFARIRDTHSDPYCSLLVSQSILNQGTIRLDAYRPEAEGAGCIREIGGHLYDSYPLGTPLLALPVVYGANSLGLDMSDKMSNAKVQVAIATTCVPLIFIFLFAIGRAYTNTWASFIIAFTAFLGGPAISSLGGALWSHTLSVLFISMALFIIALYDTGRLDTDKSKASHAYLTGALLFLAYLCRPTASIFILGVFGYLAYCDRAMLARAGGVSFCLLMCFAGFSMYEYGSVLPPYYFNTIGSPEPFLRNLSGLLISPSRGLFVFSPITLVILALALFQVKQLLRSPLFIMLTGWFAIHTIVLANYPAWHGGNSFGPRLMVDSYPALVVVGFISWAAIEGSVKSVLRPIAITAFCIVAAFAIWVNAWQGLYNPWTQQWNFNPYHKTAQGAGERVNTDIIFNWRYPQFLMNATEFDALVREYLDETLGKGAYRVTVELIEGEGNIVWVNVQKLDRARTGDKIP